MFLLLTEFKSWHRYEPYRCFLQSIKTTAHKENKDPIDVHKGLVDAACNENNRRDKFRILGLIFVLPLFFHVKGILYREMFGIKLKIVASQDDSGSNDDSDHRDNDDNTPPPPRNDDKPNKNLSQWNGSY